MGSYSPSCPPSTGDHADLCPPPWFDLEQIWQLDPDSIRQGLAPVSLSSGWRLLVLGDGHTTRNLQLLTGQTIEAHVLENQLITHPEGEEAPRELAVLDPPWVRRQVWLGQSQSASPLLYAVSWWNQARMQESLPDLNQPIGRSLMQSRQESYREILGLSLGHNPELELVLQQPGPFLARHYLLWRGGYPLTLIYEVFSPALSLYLGPMQ